MAVSPLAQIAQIAQIQQSALTGTMPLNNGMDLFEANSPEALQSSNVWLWEDNQDESDASAVVANPNQEGWGAYLSRTVGGWFGYTSPTVSHSVTTEAFEQQEEDSLFIPQRANRATQQTNQHPSVSEPRQAYTRVVDVAKLGVGNYAGSGYRLTTGDPRGTIDETGASVTLTDYNDDGFADPVVGSAYSNKKHQPTGRIDGVFGTNVTQPAEVSLSDYNSTSSFHVRSNIATIGGYVTDIDDVNRDGKPDFVVVSDSVLFGNCTTDPNEVCYTNKTIAVVYGTEDGYPNDIDVDELQEGQGFYIEQTDTTTGLPVNLGAVTSVGDLGQTGHATLVISDCQDPTATRENGQLPDEVCILPGRSDFPLRVNLQDLISKYNGTVIHNLANGLVVYAPAKLGDVTGDELPDFGIGCPYYQLRSDDPVVGRFYVFFGKEGGLPPVINNVEKYFKDPSNGVIIEGAPHDRAGASAVGLRFFGGAVNDIAMSAPQKAGYGPGKIYIFKGPINETINGPIYELVGFTQAEGAVLSGECDGDQAGIALAPGGTFYGNPLHESLVIGTGPTGNKAYIKEGEQDLDQTVLPGNKGIKIISSDLVSGSGAQLGVSVAGGKDIDGNGRDDALIGEPYGPNGGAAFVVLADKPLPGAEDPGCPVPFTPSPSSQYTPSPSGPTLVPSPAENHSHDDGLGAGSIAGITMLGLAFLGAVCGVYTFFGSSKEGNNREGDPLLSKDGLVNNP